MLNNILLNSYIGAYSNFHQRGLIQKLMEIDADTHKHWQSLENPAEERKERLLRKDQSKTSEEKP